MNDTTDDIMKHHLYAQIYINNQKQPIVGNNYRLTYFEWFYVEKTEAAKTYRYTIHAEEDAINKFSKRFHHLSREKIRRMKIRIVVIRYDKNGNLVNAKPCKNCMRIIKKYGIKKIEYSDNGIITTLDRT